MRKNVLFHANDPGLLYFFVDSNKKKNEEEKKSEIEWASEFVLYTSSYYT